MILFSRLAAFIVAEFIEVFSGGIHIVDYSRRLHCSNHDLNVTVYLI